MVKVPERSPPQELNKGRVVPWIGIGNCRNKLANNFGAAELENQNTYFNWIFRLRYWRETSKPNHGHAIIFETKGSLNTNRQKNFDFAKHLQSKHFTSDIAFFYIFWSNYYSRKEVVYDYALKWENWGKHILLQNTPRDYICILPFVQSTESHLDCFYSDYSASHCYTIMTGSLRIQPTECTNKPN